MTNNILLVNVFGKIIIIAYFYKERVVGWCKTPLKQNKVIRINK